MKRIIFRLNTVTRIGRTFDLRTKAVIAALPAGVCLAVRMGACRVAHPIMPEFRLEKGVNGPVGGKSVEYQDPDLAEDETVVLAVRPVRGIIVAPRKVDAEAFPSQGLKPSAVGISSLAVSVPFGWFSFKNGCSRVHRVQSLHYSVPPKFEFVAKDFSNIFATNRLLGGTE